MHVKSLKAKRSEETREALVAVATRIFGERGFAGAATEEIVAEAGVTRGALYHHFADKKELFAAVAEDLERCLCDRIAADVVGSTDARSMLEGGTDSFLAACLDPVLRQVLMIDAPSVLGWLRWREIEARYAMGLVRASLELGMQEGAIEQQPVDPLCHLLLGATIEAGLVVAHADDTSAAHAEMAAACKRLIAVLCTSAR